jgi:GAF domain-containing protein
MNLKEICLTLSREIHKLAPYERLAINLAQIDENYFRVYAEESRLPASAIPEGLSVREGTATGWVLDHHEPLICRDVLRDSRFPLTHKRYKDVGLRSYVILPLMADGKALGALNLASLKPRCYGKKEVEILSPIAVILSLAVQNSNLYEAAHGREETQRLLKELNQDITTLDVDSLLRKLTDKVREVFKVDVSDVRILENSAWRVLAASGVAPGHLWSGNPEPGPGRSRWIIENRTPLWIPDITQRSEFTSGANLPRLGLRGYLGVPLVSRSGEIAGVLRALTYQPRVFIQEEVDLLQQLANGVTIAIENARLINNLKATNMELERSIREQRALRQFLSNILLLDLDKLLQRLTEEAASLFQAQMVSLRLLDEEGKIRTRALTGDETLVRLMNTGEEGKLIGRGRWMLDNRRPLTVKDMAQDSDRPYHGAVKAADLHGFLGVPLFSREQKPLGMIFVMTRSPREFTQRDLDLIEQFANAAVIAIENARLFEEARQKSLHLETLIKVNRDVASLLKRDLLLPSIANEARRFLNVDGASFRLVEGKSLVRAGYAGDEDLLALTPVMPLGESITGKIVRENRVIAVKNVRDDSMMVEKHRMILSQSGYCSFLGVPLRLGQRVIGTINLYSKQEREFRPDEIQMITAFADQTAIAVENARLFEEVQKKSGELEDAFRTKTDFLNTMAHELRTPLNVVIGTQQLLVDGSYGNMTDEQSKALERIGRYAQDLLNLINEILDLVRLDARKVPVHESEFSVREITDDLELSFAPLAREKCLDLKFDIAADIPSLISDRPKIREILQNLLANAVKYTEKGEIELRVSLQNSNSGPQGRRISWSVRDTGIGIGESDLPRLFEPFFMADGVDRRKYPGTGLGLSIVKRLVELLDGDINIESELGKSSTFSVSFPMIQRNAEGE